MKKMWRIGLAMVAFLALAGVAVGFVAAQTDGDGEAASEKHANFVARLAENLAITQEELEQAIQQTQLELVDERLAAGDLTAEQADRIRERIASGEAKLFPHGRHRPQGGAQVGGKVADFLGVTPEEVVEGLKAGQSLAQIAEANGVSAVDLSAFLLGELEVRLAEAVEKGKIDQARADEILANAPERIDQLINHEGLPDGKRQFGPHRLRQEAASPEACWRRSFQDPSRPHRATV